MPQRHFAALQKTLGIMLKQLNAYAPQCSPRAIGLPTFTGDGPTMSLPAAACTRHLLAGILLILSPSDTYIVLSRYSNNQRTAFDILNVQHLLKYLYKHQDR